LLSEEKHQKIFDQLPTLKKNKQEIFVEKSLEKVKENQEKDEEADETKSEKRNNFSAKSQSMGFDNQKNEFVKLPTPLPPSSPSV
jgi:hypothetical protein